MLKDLTALFDRDLTALAKEVSLYPSDEALWREAPGIANPGGNLVLHLCGNLRHYIGFQLGNIEYTRDRPAEFSTRNLTREQLLRHVETARTAVRTLENMTSDSLEQTYPENVLGQPMTTGFFLIHLYGHLRYHAGQVNYHRRLLAS